MKNIYKGGLCLIILISLFVFTNKTYAAAPAVSTAIIQDVGTTTFSIYLTGTSFNAFVSSLGYDANSTDLLGITYNSVNPISAVIVEDGTIKHLTAVFPLSASSSVSTNLTIAANTIKNSTTQNTLITKAINAFIILTEISPVVSGPTNTPSYTFNTTATGTITYTGGCTSASTTANTGNNTIIFNSLSNGTYSGCKIQITDSGGNVSTILSVTSFTVGEIDGFVGQYWNLDSGSYNPSFPNRSPDLTRTDSSVDFNWSGGSPDPIIHNDAFIVRWTKTLTLISGTYHFHISSDDGHRIFVDGVLLSDNWGGGETNTTQTLVSGNHTIIIEYYENGGGASVYFNYYRDLPGSGTSEDPYQVTTCDDLQAVTYYLSSYIKLMGDVDCSNTQTWNSQDRLNYNFAYGNGSTPTYLLYSNNIRQDRDFNIVIGSTLQATSTYSVDYVNGIVTFNSNPVGYMYVTYSNYRGFEPIGFGNTFSGEFNGDGHLISGLNIDRQDYGSIGLFSHSTGYIHDVTLSSTTIRGSSTVGGFVSSTDGYALTKNIQISGIIQGWGDKIGGIVGANRKGSKIINATSTALIVGSGQADRIGGITGANGGYIRNTYSSSDIDGEYEIGGISGRSGGSIINSYATGNMVGKEDVGGLLGHNDGGSIANSHATGNVYASQDNSGGLVGRNANIGAIISSYSTGNVSSPEKTGGFAGANGGYIYDSYSTGNASGTTAIGGFVGRNGGTIQNTYSIGNVLGSVDVGGFLGYMETNSGHGHSVSGSFWNLDTSGQSESVAGIGKTTSELKSSTTFSSANWDLDNVWLINPDSYPILRSSALFTSGSGTDEDPYHITNCTQLQNIDFDRYAVYELDNNIDCSETSHWNPVDDTYQGFRPIGREDRVFGGKLDGNNHIISNLYINKPNDYYVGLFGATEGSTLTRIYLKNVDITGRERVGALVGDNSYNDNDDTLISHSGVSGRVYGNNRVGGLVGTNHHHGIISESFSLVDVTASDYIVGGFIGANGGNIYNSYSAGSVMGIGDVGGFAGKSGGVIEKSYSIASSTADGNLGQGFLGSNDGGSRDYSFWDSEKTGLVDSEGGVAIDTASMKSQGYLEENGLWDFESVWAISGEVNNGYPYLQGQQDVSLDADTSAPTILNILSTPSNTSVIITWTTNEESDSQIIYSTDTTYGTESNISDESPKVTSHSVSISNLLACTLYHYKVKSSDVLSNVATSEVNTSFVTTGCVSGAIPTISTSTAVTVGSGGTTMISNSGSGLIVFAPENFTNASTSVVIQIKALTSSLVINSIGKPLNTLQPASGVVFDVKALVDNITTVDFFDIPVTITYQYSNSDISGINESSLVMYHYHNGEWSALDACSIDVVANTITCTAPSFSIFAIFGTPIATVTTPSSGVGRSGGSTTYGCKDPKALNYDYFTASNPSLCKYGTLTATSTTVLSSKKFVFTRDLKKGMTGNDINELQKFLIAQKAGRAAQKLAMNGTSNYFGNLTQDALIEFQISKSIKPSIGYFGPVTRSFFNK